MVEPIVLRVVWVVVFVESGNSSIDNNTINNRYDGEETVIDVSSIASRTKFRQPKRLLVSNRWGHGEEAYSKPQSNAKATVE